MTFTVGETVVYPNHGAAIIEDIETRQIKVEDKEYLVLRIVVHIFSLLSWQHSVGPR